jgi:hypothetical protein
MGAHKKFYGFGPFTGADRRHFFARNPYPAVIFLVLALLRALLEMLLLHAENSKSGQNFQCQSGQKNGYNARKGSSDLRKKGLGRCVSSEFSIGPPLKSPD